MNIPIHTTKSAYELCKKLILGKYAENEIVEILATLAERGETVEEIVGFAQCLRDNCIHIPVLDKDCVDVCGTGGSGLPRMNLSTAIAFALAADGVTVSKHGNRAVGGRSGSFNVLEVFQIPVEQSPYTIATTISKMNLGFIFAPLYHPALKKVARARKIFGKRSIFNLVGPLINPTSPQYQLLGTTDVKTARLLAQALKELGTKHAIVVCGSDGLDDVTLTGTSTYVTVTPEGVSESIFDPREFGFELCDGFEELAGGDAIDNAKTLIELLQNKAPKALQDLAVINTAFALFACKKANDIGDGIWQARKIFESKKGYALLYEYKALAQKLTT